MKLIIIHGAEATGKLTVAKSLAALTGFQLFHNHVTVDVARTLFEFGDPRFADLIWDVRLLLFEYAAKARLDGLIFTWAFSYPDFMPYLARIRAVLDQYQTEICPVFLYCVDDERERRVISAERHQLGKIHTVEHLHKQATVKNYRPIPNAFQIDNTHLTPDQAAKQIIKQFNLHNI